MREQAKAQAYLGLGGNMGDAQRTIARALTLLAEGGAPLLRRSSDYQTPPWGLTAQPPFINACALVETTLPSHDLLALCLEVEKKLGRVRGEKWGPRLIDIDLLIYEKEEIATANLIIPHPHMLERAFVLVPLAEIAPELVIKGRSIARLAAEMDKSGIKKII